MIGLVQTGAVGTGVVAMEGHPVWPVAAPTENVPVKSVFHAGGFRHNAFKVVGFNGTVTDFSDVRFPGELRNCLKCHVDVKGKGTFELPLKSAVLGSTVKTGSTIGYVRPDGQIGNLVDLDPTNNLRITPTASVCSACHDGSEVRRHMQSNGAVFGATQSMITPNPERCVLCHGPGKRKDVRRVHEVSETGEGSND